MSKCDIATGVRGARGCVHCVNRRLSLLSSLLAWRGTSPRSMLAIIAAAGVNGVNAGMCCEPRLEALPCCAKKQTLPTPSPELASTSPGVRGLLQNAACCWLRFGVGRSPKKTSSTSDAGAADIAGCCSVTCEEGGATANSLRADTTRGMSWQGVVSNQSFCIYFQRERGARGCRACGLILTQYASTGGRHVV